jgi:heterodisulfide reductase subunit A
MGRLLQSRQTDVAVSFFYIDVQTYGKDFPIAYAQARDHLNMVRAIPGEVRATAADELEVITFDPQTGESREDRFDVVVLSVGLLPSADNRRLAQTFDLTLDDSGWLSDSAGGQPDETAGVFTAGTVSGPMTIAQSISSAEQTVYALLHYLGVIESRQGAA